MTKLTYTNKEGIPGCVAWVATYQSNKLNEIPGYSSYQGSISECIQFKWFPLIQQAREVKDLTERLEAATAASLDKTEWHQAKKDIRPLEIAHEADNSAANRALVGKPCHSLLYYCNHLST